MTVAQLLLNKISCGHLFEQIFVACGFYATLQGILFLKKDYLFVSHCLKCMEFVTKI